MNDITTLEESLSLRHILDETTADFVWVKHWAFPPELHQSTDRFNQDEGTDVIPAWSLSALLRIIVSSICDFDEEDADCNFTQYDFSLKRGKDINTGSPWYTAQYSTFDNSEILYNGSAESPTGAIVKMLCSANSKCGFTLR